MTKKPPPPKQPRATKARALHVDTPAEAALRAWVTRVGKPEAQPDNAPRPSLADELAAALKLYRKGLSPSSEYNPMNSIPSADLVKRAIRGDVMASRYLVGELADHLRNPRTPDPTGYWLVDYFAPRLEAIADGTMTPEAALLQPPGRETIWRNAYRNGWLRVFVAIHAAHRASDADMYRWIERHIGVKPSTARTAIKNPKGRAAN